MKAKQISSFFCMLLLGFVTFISCDYVRDVTEISTYNSTGGSTSGVVYRKVLLEDYTGHKCGNCPAAATELKRLESIYNEKVIPLAIHAGFFSTTNAQYPTNFQTTVGTDYDNTFGISLAGNPNGLVNRKGFGTPGFIKAYPAWETESVSMDSMQAYFSISIANNFNAGTNKLNTDITIKAVKSITGNFNLVVLLSEDSIVAEQLDYSLPVGSQFIPNYLFSHVLRGAVNSTWGDQVFNGSVALNDSIVKSYTNWTVNAAYVPSRCHVVAFIYDADTGSPTYYEVFQAEQKWITTP